MSEIDSNQELNRGPEGLVPPIAAVLLAWLGDYFGHTDKVYVLTDANRKVIIVSLKWYKKRSIGVKYRSQIFKNITKDQFFTYMGKALAYRGLALAPNAGCTRLQLIALADGDVGLSREDSFIGWSTTGVGDQLREIVACCRKVFKDVTVGYGQYSTNITFAGGVRGLSIPYKTLHDTPVKKIPEMLLTLLDDSALSPSILHKAHGVLGLAKADYYGPTFMGLISAGTSLGGLISGADKDAIPVSINPFWEKEYPGDLGRKYGILAKYCKHIMKDNLSGLDFETSTTDFEANFKYWGVTIHISPKVIVKTPENQLLQLLKSYLIDDLVPQELQDAVSSLTVGSILDRTKEEKEAMYARMYGGTGAPNTFGVAGALAGAKLRDKLVGAWPADIEPSNEGLDRRCLGVCANIQSIPRTQWGSIGMGGSLYSLISSVHPDSGGGTTTTVLKNKDSKPVCGDSQESMFNHPKNRLAGYVDILTSAGLPEWLTESMVDNINQVLTQCWRVENCKPGSISAAINPHDLMVLFHDYGDPVPVTLPYSDLELCHSQWDRWRYILKALRAAKAPSELITKAIGYFNARGNTLKDSDVDTKSIWGDQPNSDKTNVKKRYYYIDRIIAPKLTAAKLKEKLCKTIAGYPTLPEWQSAWYQPHIGPYTDALVSMIYGLHPPKVADTSIDNALKARTYPHGYPEIKKRVSPDTKFVSKWDKRFMDLAKLVATWSKDPSTKVGAALIDKDHRVVSTGYNGFPKNVTDREEDYNTKNVKYGKIIHAEINAILYAHKDLQGTTLYIYSIPPCSRCAALIIQSGVTRVVFEKNDDHIEPIWDKSFTMALEMFTDAGVIVERVVGDTLVPMTSIENNK